MKWYISVSIRSDWFESKKNTSLSEGFFPEKSLNERDFNL